MTSSLRFPPPKKTNTCSKSTTAILNDGGKCVQKLTIKTCITPFWTYFTTFFYCFCWFWTDNYLTSCHYFTFSEQNVFVSPAYKSEDITIPSISRESFLVKYFIFIKWISWLVINFGTRVLLRISKTFSTFLSKFSPKKSKLSKTKFAT